MKKLLIVTVLLAASFSVSATTEVETYNVCQKISTIAGEFVNLRMSGYSMEYVTSTMSDANNKTFMPIISEAYDTPRVNDDKINKRTASEFKTEILVKCIQHFKK